MIKRIKEAFRKFKEDDDYEDVDDVREEKVELSTSKTNEDIHHNSSGGTGPVHLSSYPTFVRDLPRLVSRKTNHYRVRRKNQHVIRSSLLNLTSVYHLLISWYVLMKKHLWNC